MVVRAIRSIAAGEEISENYGPIFLTTPEAERKRTLRWQYWFDCSCEACTAHWPLLDEIDPTILRYGLLVINSRLVSSNEFIKHSKNLIVTRNVAYTKYMQDLCEYSFFCS